MNISIYICYNKKTDRISDPVFKYIYCGARENGEENFMPGTLRDDNGENISGLYRYFGSYTAIYWAWKNDHDSDYIGFMAADRQLNFSQKQDYPENKSGSVEFACISEEYLRQMFLDAEHIAQRLAGIDTILPKSGKNCEQETEDLYDSQIKLALSILAQKFPDWKNISETANAGNMQQIPNIFVMKRELFDKYCSLLFPTLLELHEKTDYSDYSVFEQKIPCFIAQALLGFFINNFNKVYNTSLNIYKLQQTCIKYPYTVCEVPGEDVIPVVMSFDDGYCKYSAACIDSIIANINDKDKYKIFILNKNISKHNKNKLNKLVKKDNISIDYVDLYYYSFNLDKYVKEYEDELYYRLIIPKLFKNYDKVIYIDADTIVKKDLKDLYATDISGQAIAGVCDLYNTYYHRSVKSLPLPYHIRIISQFYKNFYNTRDPYINCGVLLFNIKKVLALNLVEQSLRLVGQKLPFLDQDILNKTYCGHKKILDMKWNLFNDMASHEANKRFVAAEYYEQQQKAAADPYIIHYPGIMKPWLHCDTWFAEDFWRHARNTPYYEELLLACQRKSLKNIIRDMLFPLQSRRKKAAKNLYFTLKKFLDKSFRG